MIGALDPSLPAGEFRQVTNEKLCDALLAYHQKQIIKGFKFGIYAAAGETTCGDRAGTLYHERSDAAQFKEWGVSCESTPAPAAASSTAAG